MTVKELIEKLQGMEQDRIVVLSRDEEGNGFSPLQDVELMMYDEGEIGYERLTPAMVQQGYAEEDVMDHGSRAVVLWP